MNQIIERLKTIPDWTNKYQHYNRENHLDGNFLDRLDTKNIDSLTKNLFKQ